MKDDECCGCGRLLVDGYCSGVRELAVELGMHIVSDAFEMWPDDIREQTITATMDRILDYAPEHRNPRPPNGPAGGVE